jgi:hypothetical protein
MKEGVKKHKTETVYEELDIFSSKWLIHVNRMENDRLKNIFFVRDTRNIVITQ